MPKKHPKIGLALGAGAYRGFAHIGVIKSFLKNNIPIDYLSGCSAGALAAAYYALFADIDKLETDFIKNARKNFSWLVDLEWSSGLIAGKKFLNYLQKDLKGGQFKDVKIPLQIVATNLANGQPYIFKSGSLAEAVRASTSVPIIFKPYSYQDKLLIDGGLCNPVPGDLVRDLGADIVVGVNLYNRNEFLEEKINMANVANRVKKITLYNLAQVSLTSCDVVIEPDISPYIKKSSLAKYFTSDIAAKINTIGESAADKVVPEIKKRLNS